MIDPSAVREYLTRPRDDHTWMKHLSERRLDRALAHLRPRFQLARPKKDFRIHQKVCFLLGIAYPQFAFWLDMGTGKTRLALELCRYWYSAKRLRQAVVIVPSEMSVIGWENQIKYWRIDTPYLALLNSSSQDKWDEIAEFSSGLIIVTYAGLVRMLTDKKLVKVRGRKKMKLVINTAKLKKFATLLDAIVLDESTKAANGQGRGRGSLIFRICDKLCAQAGIRYALAGRPFGRDPIMLWAQHWLVDRGETLGDTLGMFRQAFYEPSIGWGGWREYKFKKKKKKQLAAIIRHRSITYSTRECFETTEVQRIVEECALPEEAQAYYTRFVRDIKRARGNYTVIRNSFIRMRQVSSGFVGFKDDETGERAEISFAHNPKLELLLEQVEQVPFDCKFVIAYEFTHSGRLIHEQLKKMRIDHDWVWGGMKKGSARRIQDDFDHNPKKKGMLLQCRKGAYGLNLQVANYLFVFESPVAVIDRDQLDKRVAYRDGQLKPVFIKDLVVRGTADSKILKFHRQGGSLWRALRRNPSKALAA